LRRCDNELTRESFSPGVEWIMKQVTRRG